jgi:cobalt-zinc-cadmium efflux system outer membrane protein
MVMSWIRPARSSPRVPLLLALLLIAGCVAPEPPEASRRDTPAYLVGARDRGRPSAPPNPPAGTGLPDLGSGPLTLERAIAIAEERNPALAALEREVAAARGRELQAGLLPNPEVTARSAEGPLYRGFGQSINLGEVSYPIAVGGRIAAAEAAAAKAREAAEANLALGRRILRADVRAAFALGLAWQARLALTRELVDLARESRRIAEARVHAGDAPEAELLKAEVELKQLLLESAQVDSELVGARRRIATLLGSPGATISTFAGTLPTATADVSLPAARERVLAGDPRVRALTRRWEEARLDLLLARRERIPDVTVAVAAGSSPDVRATNDAILEVGISLPIPLFNRNQGRIAEAEANIGRAAREAEAGTNEALLELAEAHRRFEIARERVRRYLEDILPRAERSLAQARSGYQAGKLRFLDVLDAQRTLGQARGLYLDALRDMAIARAELDRFIGE